jgi:hypothetical protein
MSHNLFRRSTIPAWIAPVLLVVENIRRADGWWREIDFFWRALKQRNEVLNAIVSPYGQLGLIVIAIVWLFVSSRPRAESEPPGEDGETETAPQPAAKIATAVVPPIAERIVVDVTPEFLTNSFEQHTTIQATTLVRAYKASGSRSPVPWVMSIRIKSHSRSRRSR